MKFKHKLYHYQKDVLNVFQKEVERWDKKIHIVAPPGSWKTIMGIEMLTKIDWNHLILVPNITLQYQWKDKIKTLFLEEDEEIQDIVSINLNEIKKINILTYQSLSSSWEEDSVIINKILDKWYTDFKDDYKSKNDFTKYIEDLKEIDIKEYSEKFSKYKKSLKQNDELVSKLLSEKVITYFNKLNNSNIWAIIVDEAHHLTNWWSKVIYYLWEWLWNKENNDFDPNYIPKNITEFIVSKTIVNKENNLEKYPFIIWLTATPPYDDIDFFTLDDDYSKLLWEVDYYIPTPAVVKSGRLAPWSDLVYFVEPWSDLKEVLKNTDKKLDNFLDEFSLEISEIIFSYIKNNYDRLINKSYNNLVSYLKFIKNKSEINISDYYFDKNISNEIQLENIAKTVWKYLSILEINKLTKDNLEYISDTKELFYELWYIWRSNNFYKFRTQIENLLVYSKSKINWIKAILDQEIINLWDDLKCAIITDFLKDKDWIISCKYILKELKNYENLKPILVSWQWIWKLSNKWELEEIDTSILEVTRKLESWQINLIIWTRWILWEWWDCPKLNTLIDLTWIVAYMSVNQVRWRAIRLDRDNLEKVSNIYDIVTYYPGYTKEVDLSRLERKHGKFYWVDDTWLIIKWVDHIYPNISKKVSDFKEINKNMLKRSTLRDYYYKLWSIWWTYQNKEVFWLDLELNDIWRYLPFVYFKWYDSFSFLSLFKKKNKLENISWKNFYFELIYRFLNSFIKNIMLAQIKLSDLPKDFSFKLIKWEKWNFKLISSYKDSLIVKKFILDIGKIFSNIIDQKYALIYPFAYFNWDKIIKKNVFLWLPDVLCKNKEKRLNFYEYIRLKYIRAALLFDWWFLFYLPSIFSKKIRLINKYKKIYKRSSIDYVYLKVNNDKKWATPFIESKLEKIWT